MSTGSPPDTAADRRAIPGEDGELPINEAALAVEKALDAGDTEAVREAAAALHAADLADLFERLRPDRRPRALASLGEQFVENAEFLTYLQDDIRAEILDLLDTRELGAALAELDSDDAVWVIEDLDEAERARVLAELPPTSRVLVEEGLTYPEASAGRLMQREIVALPMFWTVGKTIDYLRAADELPDEFYTIFTIDPMIRPTGNIALSRILRSRRSVKLADLINLSEDPVRTVPADLPQDDVAYLFLQYGLVSAPVVNEAGRLIGVLTVDDVVTVIDNAHEQDMLKLGGVSEQDIYSDVARTVRGRLPWLTINLATAILASLVIGIFEHTIERVVALAVLMPIVASMGGNAGTQSLTVVVRGIATRELTGRAARRAVVKESLVGGINGVIFASIAALVSFIWFGEPLIAAIIALAMTITLLAAGLTGTVIPFALDRLNVDPAIASSIFLTTVTDVVGFLAFLGLAAWILL